MGYYNPIYIYGVERFLADAHGSRHRRADRRRPAAGDGRRALHPGAARPASTSSAWRRRPPTTSACPRCSKNTSGFVYYVSMTGITGSALPDTGEGRRRGRAHQGPHRPAGLRRLRRQDGRAGAGHRRVGRRRRRRHGDRQRGRQRARPKDGKTTADPAEAVATLVSGLAAGRARRAPCCRRIVAPCLSARSFVNRRSKR